MPPSSIRPTTSGCSTATSAPPLSAPPFAATETTPATPRLSPSAPSSMPGAVSSRTWHMALRPDETSTSTRASQQWSGCSRHRRHFSTEPPRGRLREHRERLGQRHGDPALVPLHRGQDRRPAMKQRDRLAVFVLIGDLWRWSYGRRRRGTPDPHAPKVHPFRLRNPRPRLGKR
jgi:hypothetical protein